jgi:hypothetical protein
MQAVVGVARNRAEAEAVADALRKAGCPDRHVSVLSPSTPEAVLSSVPTAEAEQPGIGMGIGSVVGGAAGTAGGMAVASLAVPGVGPVVAIGALALGLLGLLGGAAVGSRLDDRVSNGLPKDELYVYRDALRKGRSVVIALVEGNPEVTDARALMEGLGVETVDAARGDWWIGLRDAARAEYSDSGTRGESGEAPH